MIEGRDREETIRLTAEALGIGLVDAAFIVAQEYGDIGGDMIDVDEDGGPKLHRDDDVAGDGT